MAAVTDPGARGAARRTDVLAALTASDLRARYGRGPLRLVKWLLDPFALVGVYLLLVTLVLDRPGVAPGLSIACAVVPFQLMMSTVINAMGALNLRRSILLNMGFDRSLVPVSAALTEAVAFAGCLLLLGLLMAIYGIAPTAAIGWLPLVVLLNLAFAVATAFPSALFGLWFPDLRPFGISFVRTLFFAAPGLVPLSEVPPSVRDWLKLNPLTGLFESFRAVLLRGEAPELWSLAVPAVFVVVLLAVFVPVYRRDEAHLAKILE